MTEVFKTKVTKKEEADEVVRKLSELLPHAAISFDLEDCDNVLRIEGGQDFDIPAVLSLVRKAGFHCEVLEN